jgi:hypothetical protein
VKLLLHRQIMKVSSSVAPLVCAHLMASVGDFGADFGTAMLDFSAVRVGRLVAHFRSGIVEVSC